ncbi:MAG: hypothetical protein QM809_17250 [Gordonia sp. (in: high G+C Gram-positive bacteria)]|uniref:hypothetical protein n=1 Tax=Gordonia sp. (in: high G+C Gram-positive bacteria) TaxID=84139 RepID=UPI0039E677A5
MSAPNSSGGIKTLAIRLDPATHGQLTMIASLRDTTITDEIKKALTAHIEAARTADDLAARANQAAAEIEQEAAARKAALASLFDPTPPAKPAAKRGTRGSST